MEFVAKNQMTFLVNKRHIKNGIQDCHAHNSVALAAMEYTDRYCIFKLGRLYIFNEYVNSIEYEYTIDCVGYSKFVMREMLGTEQKPFKITLKKLKYSKHV